ncbi:MAG TPA: HAMP domain-containing sensor histidine kinase [Nocardioides sp.]
MREDAVRRDIGTWSRPRGQAWGNEAQRAVLHAIAEDVVRRSGHRVAGIEVLRSDGNLEFVAVAGSPEAQAQLVGQAAPLVVERIVAFGTRIDGWVHVPEERVDDETREWMAQYGHTPDLPPTEHPEGWRAEDRLVRLLTNDAGELRATLYLDEPLSGLRPTPESIATINAEIGVLFDAIVGIVERERFGEQVRMLEEARAALASVRPGLGLADFLGEMSGAMAEAMRVDSVDVVLAGREVPALEPHTAELEERMREVWRTHGHLVVEPTDTWGVGDTAVPTAPVLTALMARRGLGSWLLVPIGAGEDYLGTLGLGRVEGGPRWTDSEISAAAAVASEVAGVVQDSHLMERERMLNAELRDISDYRRDMVITLAHELRNPVSVLWTHLELLDRDPAVVAPARESLAAMDRAARRIEQMVEDLMALATVSDPHRATSREPVDLSEVARECCAFVATTAEQSDLELRSTIADGLVVTGEAAGLQRVVSNLLSNALKYSPAGGRVTLTLEPLAVDDEDGVRLTCADTGIGIAAADVDHVFTPFFRSGDTAARQRPGTGLGLAITEQVVKRHHGTIDVRSELGAGTTFTVWLPLTAPADVR